MSIGNNKILTVRPTVPIAAAVLKHNLSHKDMYIPLQRPVGEPETPCSLSVDVNELEFVLRWQSRVLLQVSSRTHQTQKTPLNVHKITETL